MKRSWLLRKNIVEQDNAKGINRAECHQIYILEVTSGFRSSYLYLGKLSYTDLAGSHAQQAV